MSRTKNIIYPAITIVLLAMVMSGCGIDNEEIIAEISKCKNAGLDSRLVRDGLTLKITRVECVPFEPQS